MNAPLLVELLTEELPPRALARLMQALADQVFDGLKSKSFLAPGAQAIPFATPRRLAVLITEVHEKQPDRVLERRGPAVAAAYDAAGKPTAALLGFAKSCSREPDKLERTKSDKGEYFVFRTRQKGELLKQHLSAVVEAALKKLPVPKLMRWGDGLAEFVRPVHGVVLLHGKKIVPGTVLGLKSGNKTRGHRFLSKGPVTLTHAKDYEKILLRSGKVLAALTTRRETIRRALDAAAKKIGAGTSWNLGKSDELLDEVTGLVEFPVVLAGAFDPVFLELPPECLVSSMQQHQKYFPLANKQGRLLPRFLLVSNMQAANPKQIVHGNERVLRARLSDAKFFYDQDRKQRLADRLPRLAHVVYHNKLGSQLERAQRLEKLAGKLAQALRADRPLAERAAQLCKADLLTDMVGEFPELQGVMGRYYALHDREPTPVAEAIEQHYWPRTAGGELPRHPIALCVALADKLDTLVGIYGIGLAPTGDKDPFGLRRAALGTVRVLVEKALPLEVPDLLTRARSLYAAGVLADNVVPELHGFMLERLKPYLRERGFEADEIEAVLSLNPARLDQLLPRLTALKTFRAQPEGQALAAANKRIRNILRQAGGASGDKLDRTRLAEPAERALAEAVLVQEAMTAPLFKVGDYGGAFKALSELRPTVDEFFDRVMVMVDDAALRNNRLALLDRLHRLFLNVADISRLQG